MGVGGRDGSLVNFCVELDNNPTLCRCLRLSAALGGALRGSAARGNLSSQGRRGTKATPAAAAAAATAAPAATGNFTLLLANQGPAPAPTSHGSLSCCCLSYFHPGGSWSTGWRDSCVTVGNIVGREPKRTCSRRLHICKQQ